MLKRITPTLVSDSNPKRTKLNTMNPEQLAGSIYKWCSYEDQFLVLKIVVIFLYSCGRGLKKEDLAFILNLYKNDMPPLDELNDLNETDALRFLEAFSEVWFSSDTSATLEADFATIKKASGVDDEEDISKNIIKYCYKALMTHPDKTSADFNNVYAAYHNICMHHISRLKVVEYGDTHESDSECEEESDDAEEGLDEDHLSGDLSDEEYMQLICMGSDEHMTKKLRDDLQICRMISYVLTNYMLESPDLIASHDSRVVQTICPELYICRSHM